MLFIQVPGNNGSTYTTLQGTFHPEAQGTMITGKLCFNPEFRKVMWGAAGCAIFIGIPVILSLLGDVRAGEVQHFVDLFNENHRGLIIGVLFIAVFNAVYPLAYLESKRMRKELKRFLLRTLEVHSSPNMPIPS